MTTAIYLKRVYLNNTRVPLEHMNLQNTQIFRKVYKTHEKVLITHESIFIFKLFTKTEKIHR